MRETLELALHTYPHPLHFTDEETEAQSGTVLILNMPSAQTLLVDPANTTEAGKAAFLHGSYRCSDARAPIHLLHGRLSLSW